MKIFDVKWTSVSAGPSPDGDRRSEVFLMGCRKAREGNPCEGCFNPMIWKDPEKARSCSPEDAAKRIAKFSPNKYVTFVGGEPLDQMEELSELCFLLKRHGFHVIVFTHHLLGDVAKMESGNPMRLFESIDILVDGPFIQEECIYDDSMEDGFHNAVGSGNQVVWDFHGWNATKHDFVFGHPARSLKGLYVTSRGSTIFLTKTALHRVNTFLLPHAVQRGLAS